MKQYLTNVGLLILFFANFCYLVMMTFSVPLVLVAMYGESKLWYLTFIPLPFVIAAQGISTECNL